MSLSADIETILEADEDLMELLTGGVETTIEISRQLTPAVFDENQELLPCALVKASAEIKAGPHKNSAQTTVSIFFYQRSGSDVIEPAASRVYNLLHEQHFNGIWQILFSTETPPTTDEALACPMLVQRYNVFRSKA